MFGPTEHGDLTPYFEAYHDTTTGPKREPVSYRRIAEAFALAPSRILFLSDVVPGRRRPGTADESSPRQECIGHGRAPSVRVPDSLSPANDAAAKTAMRTPTILTQSA